MERSESIALAAAFSNLPGYWTSIPSHPWLWVSPDGAVATTYRGRARILKGTTSGEYRAVMPQLGLKFYIHALVCEAFHGPRPIGAEVRHLDGNRFNNAAANLAWGTPQENAADRALHGTVASGDRNGMAKLTHVQVSEMRRLRAVEGLSYRLIGVRFGVSTMTAYRAVEGQSWK
jgi:hypothetical protein